MPDAQFTYDYELGELRETVFRIGARHEPSTNDVKSFAVVCYFSLDDGTRVEVAKIDDTPHDDFDIHLDRYYRELGATVKHDDFDVENCWEAESYLREHWRRFARTYLENHGKRLRADG
ncbi:hypothetical protein GCM10028857_28500 [Salinarchaeum chitinilyticum]